MGEGNALWWIDWSCRRFGPALGEYTSRRHVADIDNGAWINSKIIPRRSR